mgnify:CR=1 FL=1
MSVLVLQHIACEPPGAFEDVMVERGLELHRVELDEGEPLELRVLLDHSVLEVYANRRVCLSTRVYPVGEGNVLGTAFVDGEAEVELRAWAMAPMVHDAR